MSKRAKVLLLVWGMAWLGLGALAGLALLLAANATPAALEPAMFGVLTLLAGVGGGGLVAWQALHAMTRVQGRPLHLPPAWALAGGFALALATALGLAQLDISEAFLLPLAGAAAALLAPLAVAAWVCGRTSQPTTSRRGWTTFGLGMTAAPAAALVLGSMLTGVMMALIYGLGPRLEAVLEILSHSLARSGLPSEILAPWVLAGLVEAAVVAPLVEEFVKPLALLPLLRRVESAGEALLLGVLVGAGFAGVENLLYAAAFPSVWGGVLAARVLGAALHPFGSGLVAVAWWRVLRREPGAPAVWVRSYAVAAGAHAVWNATSVVTAAGYAWYRGWEVNLMGLTHGAILLALLAVQGIGLLLALRLAVGRVKPGVPAPHLPPERALALWGLACLVVLLPVGLGIVRTLL